jgi:hypothetical protein
LVWFQVKINLLCALLTVPLLLENYPGHTHYPGTRKDNFVGCWLLTVDG